MTAAVASLGHEVIGRNVTLPEVGSVTASEWPDVALVIVEESSALAVDLIRNQSPTDRVSRTWTGKPLRLVK